MRNPLELNRGEIRLIHISTNISEAAFRGGFTIDGMYWYLSDVTVKYTFVALPTYQPWL